MTWSAFGLCVVLVFTARTRIVAAQAPPPPVSHWRFDEATGKPESFIDLWDTAAPTERRRRLTGEWARFGASRSRPMAARWSPAARTAREWSGTSRTFRAARERLSGKAVSASIRGAVPLTAVWAALASSLSHEDQGIAVDAIVPPVGVPQFASPSIRRTRNDQRSTGRAQTWPHCIQDFCVRVGTLVRVPEGCLVREHGHISRPAQSPKV